LWYNVSLDTLGRDDDDTTSKSRAELTDTMSVCSAIQSPLLEIIMQVTNDTVTQQHLDAVHEGMRTAAQLWVSGLITDKEVADHFAKLSVNFQKLEQQGLLSGLLDPATGLRY
jgi:hypothetical protein